MFWKRLSVTKKLFATIALTVSVVVFFMAAMIAWNMRSGFSQYLLTAEIGQMDDLVAALAEAHDPAHPGWPDLAARPEAWHEFARTHLRPNREPPPPRDGHQPRRHPPPGGRERPPPRDPRLLGHRLSLVDVHNRAITGVSVPGRQTIRRPITVEADKTEAETVGWLVLAAPDGRPSVADDVFLSDQFQVLGLTSLIMVALSAVTAFLLARQFLAPVAQLVQGTKSLAAGSYSERMENAREDEFGELIDRFNELAESLEAAEKAERQWLSDASHELQTPLSVMRAEIEAIQDGVRQPDEHALATLHDAVLRLSRLVADLNALSHAREGVLATVLGEEDFTLLVDDAVDHARPRLDGAGISISTRLGQDLVLNCDRTRVRQLLDNLLENARRYTETPGRIEVRAFKDDDTVVLTIDDTAPAPPDDALERLFDRFYRAEPSRARQHGGSGLGLAICRAIATAHGGSIAAERSGLGGLRITVTFPMNGSSDDD